MSFTKKIGYLWAEKRSEFFFGCIAFFAVGTGVRHEMMKKGVIKAPAAQAQEDMMPKVERKQRRKKNQDE